MGWVKSWVLLGAAMVVAGAASITAASAQARLWDGSLVITSATAKCEAIGEDFPNMSLRALYRPKLTTTGPKAAIIFQTDNLSHIYVIRAVSNTRTLHGNGDHWLIDFNPGIGESNEWLGTYSINVTPTNVTNTTNEVRVTGTVRKFGNIAGCTLTFRGAFLRRPNQQAAVQ